VKQSAFFKHLEIEFNPVSHTERLVSGLGVYLVSAVISVTEDARFQICKLPARHTDTGNNGQGGSG